MPSVSSEGAAPACYTDLVPKRNETRRHVSRSLGATMTVLLLLTVMRGAWAQTSPTEYCRQIGTDDTERSVPPSLVSAVVRLFQLETMPSAQVERSTYFRCAEGHVFVCTVGANLVCGKADTRRDLPGVKAWCAEHEGSQNVPAYVTGHATIYLWRCAGPPARGLSIGTQRRSARLHFTKLEDGGFRMMDAVGPPLPVTLMPSAPLRANRTTHSAAREQA